MGITVVEVTPFNRFNCFCCICKRLIRGTLGEAVYADIKGPAFQSYVCKECVEDLKGEQK